MKMTSREKEFLKEWIYNECNRAENDFYNKLGSLYKYHKDSIMDDLIKSFYKYRFCLNLYKDLSNVLDLKIFDDTTKYKNRSAEYLNKYKITEHEDDLIYSFAIAIINGKKFNI